MDSVPNPPLKDETFITQESNSNYLLSIIVPVYNDETNVVRCAQRIQGVVKSIGCEYELLFVNDGGADNSVDLLKEQKKQDPHIKIINLSRNFGHQIAITAGLDHCHGDAAIVMDSDLQDPPELFPALIAKWQSGYDIVHARYRRRLGEEWWKSITAIIFYRFFEKIANIKIPVDVADFRLLDKKVLQSFNQLREHRRYVRGMVAWLGYKQGYVEFDRDKRITGKSQYSFGHRIDLARAGILSFSNAPLRLAIYMALISGLLAICLIGYGICMEYLRQINTTLWLIPSVIILIVGTMQLICIGIIGEYIGLLVEEAKDRPLYLVTEII